MDAGSSKKWSGFFINLFISFSSFFWILFDKGPKQKEIDEVL